MKYFFALAFILLVFFQNNAYSACIANEDWPAAPCFDTMPVNRDKYREAWAPYYNYKGSEFMEQKRAELEQAIKDGTFREWENSAENSNIYHYFHSIGVVSNQYDYFFFEDEMIWQLPSFSIFPLLVLIASIIAGATALTVFAVRAFKK